MLIVIILQSVVSLRNCTLLQIFLLSKYKNATRKKIPEIKMGIYIKLYKIAGWKWAHFKISRKGYFIFNAHNPKYLPRDVNNIPYILIPSYTHHNETFYSLGFVNESPKILLSLKFKWNRLLGFGLISYFLVSFFFLSSYILSLPRV